MRIQHNIMAMNAYRNYNNNTSALSKNLEKLSSGYKINRAGDDAAGLAISEKMRAQITGLNAAQKNVKDGVSLVKTAEGAMQEIQDMLNRMDYLATQSANGTYDNEVDRANLQKEVTALKDEINRIADSANFNGIKLLDGSIAERNSGSKTVNTTGMDRIIKSTLSPGENANNAVGMKTILEEVGDPNGQAGEFKIDLRNLQLSFTGSATEGTVAFTVNIGGTEIEFQATGVTASSAFSDILSNVKMVASTYATTASATTGFLKFGDSDMDWYVTAASGSSISFAMKEPPTTASQVKTNFDVKYTAGDKTKISSSSNIGVVPTTTAKIKGGGNAANTVFYMTEDDIVDGTKITIGTTTVTLAVGADSKYTNASNVADLTFMSKDNINLNTALQVIGNAFGGVVTATGVGPNGEAIERAFTVGVNDGANGGPIGIGVQGVEIPAAGSQVAFDTLEKLAGIFSIESTRTWEKSDGLTLQIGDTSDSFNQMTVSVGDMHTDAMGAGKDVNGNDSSKTIAEIDISTQAGAAEAVQVIKNAINYVSGVRGDLGAVQNRLEHTQNNLSVMAENIQDAESTIRDTDVAEEMMSYVKNNILVQSAQAMLAQANQVPQGVLQLLG